MAAPAAARTGQQISHYVLADLLGSGGMGEVYRATDHRLGRQVALKFLRPLADPAARQRLLREAQAAALLDHPNICTIFEVDETPGGDVFIVMAYYPGDTLARLLAEGPLPLGRALGLVVQAGRGLAAAHEELIVHRDIKPGNLLVTRGDTVKILDFGVATSLGTERAGDEAFAFGTPAYMAPEELRRDAVDQRSDIWSLGAVLYESVTGVAPFRAGDVDGLVDAVLHRQPAPASTLRPTLPVALDHVIDRALAKDPRLRYERADAMVQDLLAVQAAVDSGAITLRVPAVAPRSSIAVLPFSDLSPERDQGFLCDGIAEEVLRGLSRIPDLSVASRTSSFQYRHQTADIREIGARLNVAAVLEGSVRRAGNRVRIWAQLVNVEDGYRLWCDRYDRSMEDIFAIEDEIAEQIAKALEVTLAARRQRIEGEGSEPNARAYELYLQGRQFFHQQRRKAFETALQLFAQAIEVSPGYAKAYAGMADCHSFLKLYFGFGPEAVAAADEASARALALEPELSDAHEARGMALFLRGEFDEAERHLRHAIELDPRLYEPHYIYGRVCFSRGRPADAAEHYRDACALVPEAFDAWYLLGMCYRRLGEGGRARNASFECIEAMKRWVRVHPDDTRAWTMGAAVLAEMGEPERAASWIERALAVDGDEPVIRYNAACVYTGLGRYEEAMASLEVALGQHALSADWARNDPDLDPLRGDPRFERMLQ
ncbi:MAG: protein kinase [Vicinamibacteraceae bacterium]|nr:protein kinase [Vicinamibacteraceae bacterium]